MSPPQPETGQRSAPLPRDAAAHADAAADAPGVVIRAVRRRVQFTSSSSDDDPPHQPMMLPAETQHANIPVNQEHQAAQGNAIVIETSDSDAGDIWVRPRASQQQPPPLPNNIRRQLRTVNEQTHHRRQTRNLHRRIVGEAEESSGEHDHTSSCSESDEDAQAMYRSAIVGVRNARQSRIQVRADTQPCRICAQFAAYIANFL